MNVRSCAAALCVCLLASSVFAQSSRGLTRSRYNSGPTYVGSSSGHSGHGQHHGHHHHHHGNAYCNPNPIFGGFPGVWGGGFGFGYGGYYSSATFVGSGFGSTFTYGRTVPGLYSTYDPLVVPYYNGLNSYSTIPHPAANLNLIPLQDAQAEEERRWQDELNLQQPKLKLAVPKVSTAVERLRSRQDLMRGDEYFRKQQYSLASSSYRQAAAHAEDLAEPQFRQAVVNAALGNFVRAVSHLKRGIDLAPSTVRGAIDLDQLYGEEFPIARDSMLSRMTKWVEQDIRDPDRLLLMGAFLYRDAPDKAVVFLETSARLSGEVHYVAPYLSDEAEVAEVKQQLPNAAAKPPVPTPPAPATEPEIVPPLPEANEAPPEGGTSGEPYQPKNLGFILPRHGGSIPPVPEPAVTEQGPVLPPLGN